VERKYLDAGTGRDRGAILYYALPINNNQEPITNARLEILDPKGAVIRTYNPKPADYDSWDDKKKSLDSGPWLSMKPGINRLVWNLHHDGAVRVAGNKTAGAANEGPFVSPGVYTARLVVGESESCVEVKVVNDPRVKTSLKDLQAQEKMLLAMRDKISDAHKAVNRLRELREQVQAWQKRGAGEVETACGAIVKKLDAIEDALILPGEQKDNYNLILRARLNEVVASLMTVVNAADAKPTKAAQELFAEHAAAIDAEIAKLDAVVQTDVAALNSLIAVQGVRAVG
jgi:hypothetical protein